MKFNKYIWSLYKDSTEGRTAINKWTPLEVFPNEEYAIQVKDLSVIDNLLISGLDKYINKSTVNFRQLRFDYIKSQYKFSNETIRDLYSTWIQNGLSIDKFVIFPPNDNSFWVRTIEGLSMLFYDLYPDYFFPYMFGIEFNKLTNICMEFNIPIPEIPKKSDWLKRAFYYIELCEAFLEFRETNHLNPSEFCAFLYDFAPKNLEEIKDKEMPNPSKVWFVGGSKSDFNFLDNAEVNRVSRWQCNIDTRRGDIIIMYCVSPRSYIHSIWRAHSDGFLDPYFQYFNSGYITSPIILSHKITLKDLKDNLVWRNHPLLRKNLQGVNGYPIKYNEYIELFSILESKGQKTDSLPIIKLTTRLETNDLVDERDVEIKLIEPFFETIGYTNNDWLRQMPVRMGRGERNYPDYCFGAKPKRGEETAKMIVESKYEIKTHKELLEAYFQAKSYALRLQADIFIIAAIEGIWIFQSKSETFKFENQTHHNWIDLENPDILHKLRLILGKNKNAS